MAGVGGYVDGGRELSNIEQSFPLHGKLFRRVLDAVNLLAKNSTSSATGETQAPHPPSQVQVKTAGEMMHISISHPGTVQRNVRYFSEIATSPSFAQPLVIDHGSSRTSHPISLPAKDDAGNPVRYYVRSYAQYASSQPSPPTIVGGASNPTGFTMTGSTQMTLLPSAGSGTAPNTGQLAGQGLGKDQQRGS